MASRTSRANPPPQQQSTGVPRQNEYFVPRDGIDREVITADICRYLGNDALVRPGTYEHPDGRVTQGYYITAYRNLTSAMIQDLKADSARWDAERRAASRSQPGAAGAPSRGNDGYRNSEIHQQRQYYGPTPADPAYGDPMAVDPPSYNQPSMRYPGTGNSGYNGVNSSSSYAAHQPRYEPPPQASYNAANVAQYAAAQQSQSYSPAPQAPDMYAAAQMATGAASMAPPTGFGQTANVQDPSQYVRGAAYAQNAMNPMVTTSVQNRNMYPTAGAVYPPAADPYGYAQTVGPANTAAGYTQSIDVLYGRGSSSQQPNAIPAPSDYLASPAGNQAQGYSTVLPEHQQQYDETQAQAQIPSQNPAQPPSRNSAAPVSSSQAQISSSGQTSSSSTTNRRDRDQDRHRREDRDRDTDRHAAERHAHRHRTR